MVTSLPGHTIDGKSVVEILVGKEGATSPQEAYYFYYRKNDLEAIRSGNWKLHFPHGYRSMVNNPVGNGGIPGKYDYSVKTGLELYNLKTDPSETTNVAIENPNVVNSIKELATKIRAELGDQLTSVEPSQKREHGTLD